MSDPAELNEETHDEWEATRRGEAPVIPVGSEAVIAGLWAALGQLDSAYSAYVSACLRGVGTDSTRSHLIATRASVNEEFEDAIAAAQGTGHERVIPATGDHYEYRAATAVIKWYHRDSAETACADLDEVAGSDDDRWVERRPVVEWERIPDPSGGER